VLRALRPAPRHANVVQSIASRGSKRAVDAFGRLITELIWLPSRIFVSIQFPIPYTTMQSLIDIEQAVQNLSTEQQAELLLFVAERLRSQRVPRPEPRDFSEEQLTAWLDEDERAMERFRAGS